MKKIFVCIALLLFFSTTISAQGVKGNAIKKASKTSAAQDWEKDAKEEYSYCTYYNKYTIAQRRAMYPFFKATKILAVSFKYAGFGPEDPFSKVQELPTEGLIINNGVMDTTTLIEKKELNFIQIDKLSNLIFNTDYRKKDKTHYLTFGKCFEPRNAIIFLDSEGRVLDFLEICFNCQQYRSGSEKLDPGVLCTQKYELLSDYFKVVGITYGILGKDYDSH